MAFALDLADRERDRIVVGDRADGGIVLDHHIAGGRAERDRQRLIGLADEIALHRHDDLLGEFAHREADRARKHRAGGEIVRRRGAVEVDAVGNAGRSAEPPARLTVKTKLAVPLSPSTTLASPMRRWLGPLAGRIDWSVLSVPKLSSDAAPR
jgi:hypothetical protein